MEAKGLPRGGVRIGAACLVVGVCLLLPDVGQAAGVEWEDLSLVQALAKARQQKTAAVVDVFADWCGPCHRYDREVFNRKDVAEALDEAVAIRVNAEQGEGPSVVKHYHVVGYPTVLFIAPNGEEIDRIFGFQPAEEFRATARDFLSREGTLAELKAKLEERPRDPALRFEVGRRLTIRGDLREARRVFKPLLGGDPDNKKGFVPKIHLVLGKYAYLRGQKNYPAAIKHLAAITREYPESEQAEEALYSLAKAKAGRGDKAGALETFEAWLKRAPEEASRYNSVAWFCFKKDFALQRGIELAEAGTKLDPKAAYLWDTLAELYFKTGKKQAAVEAIKEAIAADPDEPYYEEQLKRFRGN